MTSGALDDIKALEPPSSPNWHFAGPQGLRDDIAGTIVPNFGLAAQELRASFREIVLGQPRTLCLYSANSSEESDVYEQKSMLFGFKDIIQVWSLQVDETPVSSSLVVFSRSVTGYHDFGVNRRRVRAWLSNLSRALS